MKFINISASFLFFFMSFSTCLFSQNKVIDSLKNQLKIHEKKDTTRVKLLNHIAFMYHRNDVNKAASYLQEAEVIGEKIGFQKGIAKTLYLNGVVQLMKSDLNKAFAYFNEAYKKYEAANSKKGMGECYNGIGAVYYYAGDQEKAIEYYKKSLAIDELVGDKKSISSSLNNIGNTYSNLGNFKQAISYYKKSLLINQQINNEEGIAGCYNNIGTVYDDQGNYPLALEYYNKALYIDERLKDSLGISKALNNIGIIYKHQQRYDKAIECYEKALIIQKKNDNKKNIGMILSNLGIAYRNKKEYKKAYNYFIDALNISKEANNKKQISTCLNNIGDILLKTNDNANALDAYQKALKISLKTKAQLSSCNSYLGIANAYFSIKNYKKALTNVLKSKALASKIGAPDYLRDAHELLAEIYKKTGQYKKAYENHHQFKLLNDSLFNKENIEKLTQLEYEYKYKQQLDSANIRELKLTKTVKITSENLEASQRNYLWAIIGFLVVSIVSGYIIFFLKLRNVKSKSQNIITEQRLLRSQMTPHFIFNSLSVLQGMILNKEEKKSVFYLSKFSRLLRIILENSREKTVSLKQELAAIENYLVLQNIEVKQPYKYTITVDESIDTTSFEVPPMLIQPFIENAIEHAFGERKENREIDIHLKYIEKQLICTIVDNGIGIGTEKKHNNKDKKSLATTITSERLNILSKDFNIKSSITIENRQKYNEHGTIVTLVMPYKIETAVA